MRFVLIALALTSVLAVVPSASAAPCNGDLAIEADCWVDYVQPHPNRAVDDAEEATGLDLSLAQEVLNAAVDGVQNILRPVFDRLPDRIPCVDPSGPHCW